MVVVNQDQPMNQPKIMATNYISIISLLIIHTLIINPTFIVPVKSSGSITTSNTISTSSSSSSSSGSSNSNSNINSISSSGSSSGSLIINNNSNGRGLSSSTNLHEPRIELRYNSKNRIVSLDERSPNNTVVAIVFVSDEDTGIDGETSVAIEGGNELGSFKLVITPLSNTIQVNGAPLSRQNQAEYNLTLVARDRGQPQKMSSVNLVIKLTSSPLPPHSTPEPQPSSKPPVNYLENLGWLVVVIFLAIVFLIIIGCGIIHNRPRGKKTPLPPPTTSTTSWNVGLVR